MKRVFKTNSELAHVWANQLQDEGRCGNMSFRGDTLYSYNLAIARITKATTPDNLRVVLLVNPTWSVTTNRHRTEASRAAWGCIIEVEDLFDHEKNLKHFKKEVTKALDNSAHAIKRSGYWLQTAKSIAETLTLYSKCFEIGEAVVKDVNLFIEQTEPLLASRIERQAENARLALIEHERRQAEKEAERRIEIQKRLPAWRNNEPVYLPYAFTSYLRINKDRTHVETTNGARITIETATKIWPFLAAAIKRDAALTSTRVKFDFDGYPFVSFNRNHDHVLRVGCHVIPEEELVYIAKELGIYETNDQYSASIFEEEDSGHAVGVSGTAGEDTTGRTDDQGHLRTTEDSAVASA